MAQERCLFLLSKNMKQNKIIIVDDDPSILEVLTLVLEESDYEVIALDSGEKVREIVNRDKPDLMLLDLWIPGVNGPQILTQLKNDSTTKNVPIILISAATEIKETAEQYHADAYLPKPFNIDELESTITQFLPKAL